MSNRQRTGLEERPRTLLVPVRVRHCMARFVSHLRQCVEHRTALLQAQARHFPIVVNADDLRDLVYITCRYILQTHRNSVLHVVVTSKLVPCILIPYHGEKVWDVT